MTNELEFAKVYLTSHPLALLTADSKWLTRQVSLCSTPRSPPMWDLLRNSLFGSAQSLEACQYNDDVPWHLHHSFSCLKCPAYCSRETRWQHFKLPLYSTFHTGRTTFHTGQTTFHMSQLAFMIGQATFHKGQSALKIALQIFQVCQQTFKIGQSKSALTISYVTGNKALGKKETNLCHRKQSFRGQKQTYVKGNKALGEKTNLCHRKQSSRGEKKLGINSPSRDETYLEPVKCN